MSAARPRAPSYAPPRHPRDREPTLSDLDNALLNGPRPGGTDPLDAARAAAESDAALARHHTYGTAAPLIARAVELVGRLLWCPDVEAPAALREEALLLEEELAAFERGYRAAHGPDARCPTVRAWYLLTVLREHATLLRGPVPSDEDDDTPEGAGEPRRCP